MVGRVLAWIAVASLSVALPEGGSTEVRDRQGVGGQRVTVPEVTLGTIRAQLYYEETGRLSENIAPPSTFVAWNTVIGEGDADEAADDLLVSVEVLTGGQEQNVELPLIIEARDSAGKMLGQRRVDSVLTSAKGRAHKALWLKEVGCTGEIKIKAVLGRTQKTAQLELPCGE